MILIQFDTSILVIFLNEWGKASQKHIHNKGAHGLKKQIERAANPLFLGAEHQKLQFLKSVKKKESKNVYLVQKTNCIAIKNEYQP